MSALSYAATVHSNRISIMEVFIEAVVIQLSCIAFDAMHRCFPYLNLVQRAAHLSLVEATQSSLSVSA